MAGRKTKSDKRYVVVTDLDGSLLDHFSYSWQAAQPAIDLLKRKNIPLVYCTSKTRVELSYLQHRMKINSPFISETGGAIWFDPRIVDPKPPGARLIDGLYAVVLGERYRKLRKVLTNYRREHKLELLGFGDIDDDYAAKLCDVPRRIGPMVKRRDFDEPFFFETPPPERVIAQMYRDMKKLGLNIIRGGRFYHLVGQTDKGRAITALRKWYDRQPGPPVTIIGLGDSPNDISLFRAADIPILVKRFDGRYEPRVRASIKTRLAGAIGPVGWNQAILKLLE